VNDIVIHSQALRLHTNKIKILLVLCSDFHRTVFFALQTIT